MRPESFVVGFFITDFFYQFSQILQRKFLGNTERVKNQAKVFLKLNKLKINIVAIEISSLLI